jgi:hypothetical protein
MLLFIRIFIAKDVCDCDCEYKDVQYSGLSFRLLPVSVEFSIVLVRFHVPAYPDSVPEPAFFEPDPVSANKYRNISRNGVFPSVFITSDQLIEGDDKLMEHATKYYSELFGPGVEFNIQTDLDIWTEAAMVTEADNNLLCQPFFESEVKNALFQMEGNKAARPHKIPIEFYQSCWEIIKVDIMKLFDDFFHGNVDIR